MIAVKESLKKKNSSSSSTTSSGSSESSGSEAASSPPFLFGPSSTSAYDLSAMADKSLTASTASNGFLWTERPTEDEDAGCSV